MSYLTSKRVWSSFWRNNVLLGLANVQNTYCTHTAAEPAMVQIATRLPSPCLPAVVLRVDQRAEPGFGFDYREKSPVCHQTNAPNCPLSLLRHPSYSHLRTRCSIRGYENASFKKSYPRLFPVLHPMKGAKPGKMRTSPIDTVLIHASHLTRVSSTNPYSIHMHRRRASPNWLKGQVGRNLRANLIASVVGSSGAMREKNNSTQALSATIFKMPGSQVRPKVPR